MKFSIIVRGQHPKGDAAGHLRDDLEPLEAVTREEFADQVMHWAAAIEARTEPGDRVLLAYPPGLDFVRAIWACLYSGRVAVPVPAPDPVRLKNSAPRLLAVLHDAQARLVLTTAAVLDTLSTGRIAIDERLSQDAVATHQIECRVARPTGTMASLEIVGRNLTGDAHVRSFVLNARDVTERNRVADELRHEALHDRLTGLPNRLMLLRSGAEAFDGIREAVLSIIDLHINIAAHETNRFMRVLAIVSTLALIPAVTGGLLGMNLGDSPWPVTLGQVAFVTLMLMLGVLYAFMAKGWLR